MKRFDIKAAFVSLWTKARKAEYKSIKQLMPCEFSKLLEMNERDEENVLREEAKKRVTHYTAPRPNGAIGTVTRAILASPPPPPPNRNMYCSSIYVSDSTCTSDSPAQGFRPVRRI